MTLYPKAFWNENGLKLVLKGFLQEKRFFDSSSNVPAEKHVLLVPPIPIPSSSKHAALCVCFFCLDKYLKAVIPRVCPYHRPS
jgi:hypothetical protein